MVSWACVLVLLHAAFVGALVESVEEAAVHARQLLQTERVGTLSSIFASQVNATLAGQPFAYISIESYILLMCKFVD